MVPQYVGDETYLAFITPGRARKDDKNKRSQYIRLSERSIPYRL